MSTVRPFLPERAKFAREELEIYAQGYYQALCAALRVMKPAAARWEVRMGLNGRLHPVANGGAERVTVRSKQDATDPWLRRVLVALIVVGGIFVLEMLVLFAAGIYRLVR